VVIDAVIQFKTAAAEQNVSSRDKYNKAVTIQNSGQQIEKLLM
jgi:hypothetical protein